LRNNVFDDFIVNQYGVMGQNGFTGVDSAMGKGAHLFFIFFGTSRKM
jgi:hypothetical protein